MFITVSIIVILMVIVIIIMIIILIIKNKHQIYINVPFSMWLQTLKAVESHPSHKKQALVMPRRSFSIHIKPTWLGAGQGLTQKPKQL